MPERTPPVAALVDRSLCSLAAVRGAVPHALRAGLPLVVVYQRPKLPGLTLMTVPMAVLDHEELEIDTFERVARILAPYALPWDFQPVNPGADVCAAWAPGARDATVVVTGGHNGGWFSKPGRMRAARLAKVLRRVAESVVVVECDHGAEDRSRDLILEA